MWKVCNDCVNGECYESVCFESCSGFVSKNLHHSIKTSILIKQGSNSKYFRICEIKYICPYRTIDILYIFGQRRLHKLVLQEWAYFFSVQGTLCTRDIMSFCYQYLPPYYLSWIFWMENMHFLHPDFILDSNSWSFRINILQLLAPITARNIETHSQTIQCFCVIHTLKDRWFKIFKTSIAMHCKALRLIFKIISPACTGCPKKQTFDLKRA